MMLFHGSNMEIERIDLEKCKPYKDFGKGFYLTTLPDQAEKMARRVSRIYGGSPCVTVFEFNETAFTANSIATRTFKYPSKEWALFVINNRNRDFSDPDSSESIKSGRGGGGRIRGCPDGKPVSSYPLS